MSALVLNKDGLVNGKKYFKDVNNNRYHIGIIANVSKCGAKNVNDSNDKFNEVETNNHKKIIVSYTACLWIKEKLDAITVA